MAATRQETLGRGATEQQEELAIIIVRTTAGETNVVEMILESGFGPRIAASKIRAILDSAGQYDQVSWLPAVAFYRTRAG